MNAQKMKDYISIMEKELLPAMGCTEPIALAYAVAYAKKVLGKTPDKVRLQCSGNIIKNTMAVTVPSTGGLVGIKAAALAGVFGGNADLQLEVLTSVTDEDRKTIKEKLHTDMVEVEALDSAHSLHIIARCEYQNEYAIVEIIDTHTNFGLIEKNGEVIHKKTQEEVEELIRGEADLTVKEILEFANTVNLDDVREILERQISYNQAISEEGLKNNWGASVGKTLMDCGGSDIHTQIKAAAAAGSDARMNGCLLPVVINCGSGNQGITGTLPIIRYANHIGATRDEMLRALCVSNLVAVHQKSGIGRLSAFCGALCAATAAVVGIAYLDQAGYKVICQTIINSLANVGGMVCDGAKSSCAAKIASSLDCAFMGYEMAKRGRGFEKGEGIIKEDVEKTIASVGRMASKGMAWTDKEILSIMLEQ